MLTCDFYGHIDRPNRQVHGFNDITLYFSKEFLRFRKEYLIHLYILMQFPDTVHLKNQSVLSGLEVCLRGLFELATSHKETSVAETFGQAINIVISNT